MKTMQYFIFGLTMLVFLASACSSSDNDQPTYLSAGDFANAGDDYRNQPTWDGSEDAGGDATREIIEADIFKVDGAMLYALNQFRGLYILDASNPAELAIVGHLALHGVPIEMYVYKEVAYILMNQSLYNYWGSQTEGIVAAVDVSDPINPMLVNEFTIDGGIVDSRQVGEVIYLASSLYTWSVDCSGSEYNYTETRKSAVTSLAIDDPANIRLVDQETFEGLGWAMYVSQNAVYVAQSGDSWNRRGGNDEIGSEIHYVDISNPAGQIQLRGSFHAAGEVADRFWMEEQGGTFVAVSNDWYDNSAVALETFDVTNPDNILRAGKVDLIANHTVTAVRYSENRAYVVTFMNTDPLHVVDFSNPTQPVELGQLNDIPGWSDHLEIRGTRILAVGQDPSDGGTKIVMFDTTDPAHPARLANISLAAEGGWSYSEAAWDWKAFKVYDAEKLILLPTQTYSPQWSNMVYRLNLVNFDLTAGTLDVKGHVDSRSAVKRGVLISGQIAALSDMEIQLVDYQDRDNPKVTSRVVTANYVAQLRDCGGVLCDVGGVFYDNTLRLRTYDTTVSDFRPTFESDTLEPQAGGFADKASLIQAGDASFMVSESYGHWDNPSGEWIAERKLAVHGFELSGDQPALAGSSRISLPELDNQNGYWGSGLGATTSGALAYLGVSYDYESPDGNATAYLQFLDARDPANVTLVEDGRFTGLRSLFQDYLSYYYGYYGGYGAVDAAMPREPGMSGFGYYDSYGYNYNGWGSYRPQQLVNFDDKLYVPDCVPAEDDSINRPLLACYAVVYSTTDPAQPVIQERINVPGEVVGVGTDGTILYTRDRQWNVNEDGCSYYDYFLNVMKINGDGAIERLRRYPLIDRWALYSSACPDDPTDGTDGGDTDASVDPDGEPVTEVDPIENRNVKVLALADADYTTEYTRFVIQGDRLFLIQQQSVYANDIYGSGDAVTNSPVGPCEDGAVEPAYDYTSDYRALVEVFDANTGENLSRASVVGGHDVMTVEGGGVLIQRPTSINENQANPWVIRLVYVDSDGTTTEIAEELSGVGGYYAFANGGVRIGDILYLSLGWEGIRAIDL